MIVSFRIQFLANPSIIFIIDFISDAFLSRIGKISAHHAFIASAPKKNGRMMFQTSYLITRLLPAQLPKHIFLRIHGIIVEKILPQQNPKLVAHVIKNIRKPVPASPDSDAVHIGMQRFLYQGFRPFGIITACFIINRREICSPQLDRLSI